jgi:hypothetical protein
MNHVDPPVSPAFDEFKPPPIFALIGWGLASLVGTILKGPPAARPFCRNTQPRLPFRHAAMDRRPKALLKDNGSDFTSPVPCRSP